MTYGHADIAAEAAHHHDREIERIERGEARGSQEGRRARLDAEEAAKEGMSETAAALDRTSLK